MTSKVCLLTGASGTIGFAIAEALKSSSTDWYIIVLGRRPPSDHCDKFLKVDLSDEEAVTKVLDEHFESVKSSSDQSLNRLDLLVNCAGCSLGNAPICDVSVADFRKVMELNVVVPFILSKYAMKKMATPEGGRIINIGSVADQAPRLHSIPYTTSKVALRGLNRCLSVEGRFLSETTKSNAEGGVVAVCLVNPGNVKSAIMSEEEAARRAKEEGFVEADDVGKFVANIANLPNETNALECMLMPTRQPLIGRG
ncbi:hypothetical protein ACHAWT_002171 [Skeletonema menzelii]|mmetsp:Transcript_20942/g.34343  ORF Transcript_20942/g.34343 Transcript_20942/m.34343 type:complete len:254 (-) Transcript_20942:79-840(-)|eukprot:scaffold11688_cov145-Skeletonema_menzelii.AAC.3